MGVTFRLSGVAFMFLAAVNMLVQPAASSTPLNLTARFLGTSKIMTGVGDGGFAITDDDRVVAIDVESAMAATYTATLTECASNAIKFSSGTMDEPGVIGAKRVAVISPGTVPGVCKITVSDGSTSSDIAVTHVGGNVATPTPNPVSQAISNQGAGLINIVGPALGAGVVLVVGAAAKKGEAVINNFGVTPSPSPSPVASSASSFARVYQAIKDSDTSSVSPPVAAPWLRFSVLVGPMGANRSAALSYRAFQLLTNDSFGTANLIRLNRQIITRNTPVRALPIQK